MSVDGWTKLHIACMEGKKDEALVLIEQGASITAKLSNGYTPLHSACWNGRAGASMTAKTGNGSIRL